MKQINQSKTLKTAAAKAGMSEKTARKYRRLNKLPSRCKPIHNWKTHEDAFKDDWPWMQEFPDTLCNLIIAETLGTQFQNLPRGLRWNIRNMPHDS
jgi:hypothetical protein